MKFQVKKVYIPLLIVVILVQLYIPSFKINICFQLAVLAFLLIVDRVVLTKTFLKHLLPFFLILVVGFAGTLLHKYKIINIVKDLFHFIKPVTGLLIGYLLFRKINDFRVFAKTIVTASLISAVIHLIIVAVLLKLKASSIHEVREFTRDNFLELFGMLFLLLYKRFYGHRLYKSRLQYVLAIILLVLSINLYFSRTMILSGIIIFITVMGFTKLTIDSLKVIGILALSTGLLYVYLFSTNIRREAPGFEGFLYKIKMAPGEVFETNINRDNHADLWDHWRGYEAKRAYSLMEKSPSSFVFGTGHGSLVDLKFFAPLTGDMKGIRYISELHNGYMYIFYKTGALGLAVYLFIMYRWYLFLYKYSGKNLVALLVAAIGIVYLFSTLTITGMYNTKDILIVLMGGLLYYIDAHKAREFNIVKIPDSAQ